MYLVKLVAVQMSKYYNRNEISIAIYLNNMGYP